MVVISPRRRLRMVATCAVMMGSLAGSCAPIPPDGVHPAQPWAIPPSADPATNPQAFLAFATSAARGWSGGDWQYRYCRGCPPGTYTSVQVDAVAGLASYDPPPARSGPALVARFINRGDQIEAKYGLSGGSDSLHFLVLDASEGSPQVTWRVWSVRGNTVVPGDTGSFRLCHADKSQHGDLPVGRRARFLDCEPPREAPGGGEIAGALLSPASAEVWLECGRAGCCSASVAQD